jgi:hypothetical protein
MSELLRRRDLILFKRRKDEYAKRRKKRGVVLSTLTLIVAAGIWWYGVMPMRADLLHTRQNRRAELKALVGVQALIDRAPEIGAQLQTRGELLAAREVNLAPERDTYAWMIEMIKPCIHSRDGFVIRGYAQPDFTDSGIISNFPYRFATFHLNGKGFYHDFERFINELESTRPYFRVQNVEFAGNPRTDIDSEKLDYRFDLVVPVAPSTR